MLRPIHADALAAPLLAGLVFVVLGCASSPAPKPDATAVQPNFVIVFADDLGWGDLSSYGHPTIRTPNLDRLAAEGQRWTQFYVAAPVCSPSRGALLTGRHPLRTGLYGRKSGVLFPGDEGGMPADEITLAEALRDLGYRTGMVGKWHLGDRPEHSPLDHGFDSFFGTPYSNDMMWTIDRSDRTRVIDAYRNPRNEYWNLPIYRNRDVVEQPAQQETLTRRYAEEAVAFVRDPDPRPFFLYLAHAMPHMPLFRSAEAAGRSAGGVYGDVIEEIDWSVGEITAALAAAGRDRDTLVVFTSDNGPWRLFRQHAGSAGPLRDGKATTWEGGARVPGVFWWPGKIQPGLIHDLGSAMDLFATMVGLAGGAVPADRVLDSLDLAPVLLGTGPSPRDELSYYRDGELFAYRVGMWKAHFLTEGAYGEGPPRTAHDPPLLYDLGDDPGETVDVAAANPEVVARIRARAEEDRRGLEEKAPIFDLGKAP